MVAPAPKVRDSIMGKTCGRTVELKRKGTRKFSEEFKEEMKEHIDRMKDESGDIYKDDDDSTVLKKLVRK